MKKLLACLERRALETPPVWMMRQAGRYLPEYRRSRAKAGSFLALCKTPELACEVSLQPIVRFEQLDAVIIFSDILTIPDAMGLGLEFIEGSGPRFRRPLLDAGDIDKLAVPDVTSSLAYTAEAVAKVASAMPADKTLIGFCGSPWTIACYMCANDKENRLRQTREFLGRETAAFHRLLGMLSVACADYLCLQVESGAEVVQIFDTWGGALEQDYPRHSLAFIRRVIDLLHSNLREQGLAPVPVMLYTQAGSEHYDDIADSGISALSVPTGQALAPLRQRYGDRLALQGNLDPQVLLSEDSAQVRAATQSVLDDYGDGPGHIFNLGHGITPEAKIANVEAMLSTIRP